MRTFSVVSAAAAAFVICVAGQASGFEIKGLNADTPPAEALRYGLDSYNSGDKTTALEALNFAADKGLTSAQWKLGQMYATGDGVERDDFHAFQLFSRVANSHADEGPHDPSAPYVSNAFVQLGAYFRRGIPNSTVSADLPRARQLFTYAASYFGDPAAQLNLARMYYGGEGGDKDLVQAARWANLSADKGNNDAKSLLIDISLDLTRKHMDGDPTAYDLRQATQWARRAADYGSVEGQALLGHLLFEGDGIAEREPVEGLMYLTIALTRAGDGTHWISEMHQAALSAATPEEWAAAKERADQWLAKNSNLVASNLTQ